MQILALWLLLATLAPAQQRMEVDEDVTPQRAEPRREPTQAERKLGEQMLEPAVAEARGLESPAARALLLQQIASAYDQVDKVVASELLVEAFQATAAIDDENDRRDYQTTIVRKLIARGYDVEELAAQADPKVRGQVAGILVRHLVTQKQYDRAQELLTQIGPESEFPYGAVADIMRDLPQERAGERHTMFAMAVDHFRREPVESGIRIGDGFEEMLIGNWRQLAPRAVLEAVDLCLERARKQEDQNQGRRGAISIASPQGALSFGSLYEFNLFQMLPILKQLDPGKAEKLLDDARGLSAVLERYPDGMGSLMPGMAGSGPPPQGAAPGAPRARTQNTSMTMTVRRDGPGPGGPAAGGAPDPRPELMAGAQMQQRALQIVEDAHKDPKQAIAAAASLPEDAGPMSPKASALIGIANALVEKQPAYARAALDELQPVIPRLRGFSQYSVLTQAIRAYRKLGEDSQAKKTIELGMKLARERYDNENDSSDPNQAIKPEWQSTNIWRQLLSAAADISPEYALRLLRDVPDKEVQLVQKVALASVWLGSEVPGVRVVERRKSGARTMYTE